MIKEGAMIMDFTAKGITWKLDFLYKGIDDPRIQEDIDRCINGSKKLAEDYKGKLKSTELTVEVLLDALKKKEEYFELIWRLRSYGSMEYYAEMNNEKLMVFKDQINSKFVEVTNLFLFVNLEINQLPDEHFNKLIEDSRLSSYKHYLIKTRALKPYQLSEEVEQMMSQKDLTGKQAFYNLYSELTADYKFTLEIDGEEKELNTPEIRTLFRDPVESTRKKAFEAYYQKYEDNEKY